MTDERQPPKLADEAPGLVWRARKNGWAATWQARSDLVKRGYLPKTVTLWNGAEPDETDRLHLATQCQQYQAEMLLWARGAELPANAFRGNLRSLVQCYRTDPDSPYQKNRYHVRQNRDSMLRRITNRHGEEKLSDIKARVLLAWHKKWSLDGKRLATGSSFIGQLRALFSFGATLLEDPECERLCSVMHKMRFPGTKARGVSVTAEQATAIRIKAREWFGWDSIALGQAFQFEGTLRQKDVIGEWVPIAEPGVSAVTWEDQKWLRGIVWQEVDQNLILKHVTSKKQKEVVIDLRLAPMVMEELALMAGVTPAMLTRDMLPATGPVITNEINALPWSANEYRRKWRKVADEVGIPKTIRNMDSRSGAISEGIMAGASLEMVRHAATHSDISQTADYDRNQAQATATVMRLRVENRNKPKTE